MYSDGTVVILLTTTEDGRVTVTHLDMASKGSVINSVSGCATLLVCAFGVTVPMGVFSQHTSDRMFDINSLRWLRH